MEPRHTTRTFKSGNSEAVRLPKQLGFGIGTELTIERRGDALILRTVHDAEAARAANRELIRQLREIGPPSDGVQPRPEFEMPERPGLY